MPSVFAGESFGSALIAFGVWNIASSIRPWPSGVRWIVMLALFGVPVDPYGTFRRR